MNEPRESLCNGADPALGVVTSLKEESMWRHGDGISAGLGHTAAALAFVPALLTRDRTTVGSRIDAIGILALGCTRAGDKL